jgi:CDP-diacylglycerol--serine O-phosphatidyltransferase
MAAGYYAITQSIQGSVADQGYFDRAALALGNCRAVSGLTGTIADDNTASDLAELIHGGRDYIWSCRVWLYLGFPNAAHWSIRSYER